MPALHKLNLGWTGHFAEAWPGAPAFSAPSAGLLKALAADGIVVQAARFTEASAQIVVELAEDITSQKLAQRLKGRLQHDLKPRAAGFPGFARNFLLRTLGQNTKDIVTEYIRDQVERSDLVDPLYRERLQALCFHSDEGALSRSSHAGLHDLFAHIVLVAGARYRMSSAEARLVFDALKSACLSTGLAPYEISMMPDHAHLLVRYPPDAGAEEVIERLKVASGKLFSRSAFWSGGGYFGSVGPYPLRIALDRNRRDGWCRPGL